MKQIVLVTETDNALEKWVMAGGRSRMCCDGRMAKGAGCVVMVKRSGGTGCVVMAKGTGCVVMCRDGRGSRMAKGAGCAVMAEWQKEQDVS